MPRSRIGTAAFGVRDLRGDDGPLQNSEIEMRRMSGWLPASLLAVLALLVSALGAVAAGAPAGNNGTVKIHEGTTETEPVVRNSPHVSTFHLHFYFADPGQTGAWRIRAWAPGDKGEIVLSGTYDTARDGEDRQPAVGVFTLPAGHYKLFWEGRNDRNLKHKAFWVESAAPTAQPTVAPSGSVQPTESASASPTGEVLPAEGTPPPGMVLPETDTADAAPARGTAGLILTLLVASGGMLVMRAVSLRRRRASARR